MKRLKDVSISKKLYLIVGAMALLIVIELLTLWFAIHTLSSVRALVGAEGLWSKAQKNAVYQLAKYHRTRDEKDYNAFKDFMSVPLGDHKTRMELLKPEPDMEVARQGFLEGRIHPQDIDGMIRLLRRFHEVSYIKKAIGYWTEGDSLISQLLPLGEEIHLEISSENPSQEKLDRLISLVDPLNEKLTLVEDNFSYTLGEGSRWLESIILRILFAVALTVEITGLILTIAVSRAITKGLNEINRATSRIAQGDLNERATVYSKDEIGKVASTVNQMTEQLISSNKELEQFAFIASHDLQEPLRKIQTFTDMVLESEGQLSEKGKAYLEKIQASAYRMKLLIQDLLNYSTANNAEKKFEKTDLNKLVDEVKLEMQETIDEKNGILEIGALGDLSINASLFKQVLNNLLVNSLKFSRPGIPPHIKIHANKITGQAVINHQNVGDQKVFSDKEYYHLRIEDNGLGFDPMYREKIFEVFQRLHSAEVKEGTGVGLAIVKKIVEYHNGIVIASGEKNQGACFDIYIPIS